jgi:hypothetical protein
MFLLPQSLSLMIGEFVVEELDFTVRRVRGSR